jgi:hypothetical protein
MTGFGAAEASMKAKQGAPHTAHRAAHRTTRPKLRNTAQTAQPDLCEVEGDDEVQRDHDHVREVHEQVQPVEGRREVRVRTRQADLLCGADMGERTDNE